MADPHVPMLEMLWEAHDARGALEKRFGFTDAGSAGHWVAATVHEHGGIRIDSCERIVISDRNALALVAGAPDDRRPAQLVHGDFRSANVLFAGPKIAAVIDFEEARFGHCIDEVARSAVMLGTRFRGLGPVSARVRTMFLSGYQSVRRLTPAEASWWDVLVLWYAFALVPPGDDPAGWGPSALSHLAELAPKA